MKPIHIVIGIVALALVYFLFIHKSVMVSTGIVPNNAGQAGAPSITTQAEGAAIGLAAGAASQALNSYFSSDDTGDF